MVTITKLRVVHGIACNLIDDTSRNDPRLAAIMSVRDGVAESIDELEQPKGL